MGQIKKEPLRPDRLRRPPRTGWSWIDRRFLREFAPQLSREAVLLYFFLVAVSDRHGVSYYSAGLTAKHIQCEEGHVGPARDELLAHDLVAYRYPLTQVLSLPAPRAPEGGPSALGSVLKDLLRAPRGHTHPGRAT